MKPTCVAIIPARGGSKGLPRKNVLPLCGKPLIAWTIEAARSAALVDRVVVSTDDSEIAKIARRFGAEVVERPAEISGDQASSESALLHALAHLEQTGNYRPQLTAFLQCTSPLTVAEDIDGTVKALLAKEADTAVAVTDFHYFLWRPETLDGAVGINHDKSVRLRRQDREPQYRETGAVYVMRTEKFREVGHRFFGRTALQTMPSERCWEIDDPVDFEVAEVLLRRRQQQQRCSLFPRPISAIVFDFDGVFTDNRVLVFEDGREAVMCNRGDGWGLGELATLGLPILVLSTEVNPVVRARCEKLKIPCIHGTRDKASTLRQWAEAQGIDIGRIVFVGNDANDVGCFQIVGCAVAVGDAHPSAKSQAHMVLGSQGGLGAVREVCDLIGMHCREAR